MKQSSNKIKRKVIPGKSASFFYLACCRKSVKEGSKAIYSVCSTNSARESHLVANPNWNQMTFCWILFHNCIFCVQICILLQTCVCVIVFASIFLSVLWSVLVFGNQVKLEPLQPSPLSLYVYLRILESQYVIVIVRACYSVSASNCQIDSCSTKLYSMTRE